MHNNRFFIINCTYILFLCSIISFLLNASEKEMCLGYENLVQYSWEIDNSNCEKDKHPEQFRKIYSSGLFLSSSYKQRNSILTRQLQNNPPVVKILSPENNTSVEADALVRYTISVSDEEDGKSDYQEIASNEVFLEVTYLPDSSTAADYISKNARNDADPPGLAVMKTSDCFNCHAVKSKLQGPPFAEIAKRYPDNPSTVETLAMRVIKGNSGIWGNATMPPHPDITQEQARQTIQWILNNAADPNRDFHAGLEGTFRTKAKNERENGGVYLLTASYTDHGLKDMPGVRHRRQHTIMLKSK